MIIVYHKNNRISKVFSGEGKVLSFNEKETIAGGLLELALQYTKLKIVWCEESCEGHLDLEVIKSFFYHDKMMFSYHPEGVSYLGGTIGYVEESPSIKINKEVNYPTWQMSSLVGVVHSSLLIEIRDKIKRDVDFDYYLNSVAKVCMPLGLLCYSEPRLLKGFETVTASKKASISTVFKFVKQHYRARWTFLLLLNIVVYEKKLPFLAFLCASFFKSRKNNTINLDAIAVHSSMKVNNVATIDVIVPSIGRKNELYDVLCDLRNQTHLLKNIIIVEQNPLPDSVSELDYLTNEIWPFTIKHTFIHRPGVCNARNIALEQVESKWVFFADDDIRIDDSFIQKTFEKINKFGLKAVSISCLQKGEKQIYDTVFQWGSFGSGCSFVFAESLKDCKFNNCFEFGFGEDGDFGMQLRNQGVDVLYFPEPQILHLKAPIGGFRTKPPLQWQIESVQPKPSPTVMLYQILHHTQEQISGYKIILFFKYYNSQIIKNPIRYYFNFQKQWQRSLFWANQLKQQNEV